MLSELAAGADASTLDALRARFEAMLAAAPMEIAGQALFDAATHEFDIRHAVGAPGARDSDAMTLGWEWLSRLHHPKTGVPYGIALAAAALAVYPHAPIFAALAR
jgi:hypothetical protein